MSTLFDYSVDGETRRACLQIIERAAARVARGEAACVGSRFARRARSGKEGKSRTVSDELVSQALALHRSGLDKRGISERLGMPVWRINYLLYVRGRRQLEAKS